MKKKEKDMTLADRIKAFDFYKDLPQDLSEPSVSGATSNSHRSFFKILNLLCL